MTTVVSGAVLTQYAIYENPADYPGWFVVRRWEVHDGVPAPVPCPNPKLAPSLEAARAAVPSGYFNIGRMAEDDPVIVEVWT